MRLAVKRKRKDKDKKFIRKLIQKNLKITDTY